MRRKLLVLIVAVLTLLPLQAFGRDYSVTFAGSNVETAIKTLKQVTGYDFVYQKDLIKDKALKINGSFKDRSLESILDDVVVDQMGLSYKILANTIVLQEKTTAAGKTVNGIVKGVVLDEGGEPLPGASVIVKGTSNGVSTNIDGEFEIKIDSKNPVLQVSYVGMYATDYLLTAANTSKPLRITLKSNAAMMNEVVVTGYQEVKKEKMTGAVTTISSAKLDERYSPNLLDKLEGKVAGLSTYGGSPVIRGQGTFSAGTSPLLVVDGIPIEGDIEDINPYNIESINVLKDAAAAAIYGARASNGIIVITTKNAKTKGKIDIDFSANLTLYEKGNYDYSDNFYMTPEQQVDAESDYWDYYFFNNGGEIKNPLSTPGQYIMYGLPASPVMHAYYQHATGNIDRSTLDNTLADLKKNNYAADWAKAMTHQRVMQQYNFSLRSSSDKARNNVVLNYRTDNKEIINHNESWLNVSYKGSYDIAKWLTATLNIDGVFSRTKGYGYNGFSQANSPWAYAGYYNFFNPDGTVADRYPMYSGNEYSDLGEGLLPLGVNAVEEMYNHVASTRNQNLRLHADLLFKIIPGLTANAQFIYEISNRQGETMASPDSHIARFIRNVYTEKRGDDFIYHTPKDGGYRQNENVNGDYWTARFQANYSKTFFDKHDIAVIAGLEFRETKTGGNRSILLGYDDQLQSSSTNIVDFGSLSQMTRAPYFYKAMGGYQATSVYYNYLSTMGLVKEQRHRYGSGYFNATYTFDERYNVFGSFRKDYADVFGLSKEFRGKPLWSVGAGWNLHKEEFMRDLTWISFLKLRASYGITGNIYQGATSRLTATTGLIGQRSGTPYGYVSSPANPNLRWEQTKTTNIGLDFSFLDYRLRGSLDYYVRNGHDIFSNANLDPTTGFTSMVANVASIRNKGVDLAVSYDWFRPNRRRDFGWTTSLTMSFNDNEVIEVENDAASAYELVGRPYKVGYPVSAMWSYRFAGISDKKGEQGFPLYYKTAGTESTSKSAQTAPIDALEYSGQTTPKHNFALDNTWRWNGFSLGLTMVYYGGHKMYALIEDAALGAYLGNPMPTPSYFLNGWTPENPTNTPGLGRYCIGRSNVECRNSNSFVHDASFLKIRNITLSYDFPEKWIRHAGMNHAQLRFQVNDPKALWTANKVGVDPETRSIRGRSSFMFGLNVNF